MNSKFCIITYGCTFNKADSQKISAVLLQSHYKQVDLESSEIIIINTCAVKHNTERKILSYLTNLREQYPQRTIIVTGCLPQIDTKIAEHIENIIDHKGFILDTHSIFDIDKILRSSLHSNDRFQGFTRNYCDKSNVLPQTEQSIAIIQISEGCNNHCTYCCTRVARGTLVSFNDKNIINQIITLYRKGIKEFHLTSQDLGNYSYHSLKLHDLLMKISQIQGNFRIRLGMLNPDYLNEYLEELLLIFADRRFYRFLHIPIQSFSNRILKLMNRNYTSEDFIHHLQRIRAFDPNFSIATDIIVGFPTETKNDHFLNLQGIRENPLNVINISKYSVRSNTPAKKMKQLPSQTIKKRSEELSKLYKQTSKFEKQRWLNWEGEIFINEYHKSRDYPYLGRNIYYQPILLKEGLLNAIKKVKIIKILNYSLVGTVI